MLTPCIITWRGGASEVLLSFNGPVLVLVWQKCQVALFWWLVNVGRYTWDPKQPVYRVPEEVVIRYSEVLYEGVRCGRVFPNYTVRVTCSMYGEYCGADNIRDLIPWTLPSALAYVHDRRPWFEPEPGSHAFLAFDTDRVYDKVQRLRSCNTTLPQRK